MFDGALIHAGVMNSIANVCYSKWHAQSPTMRVMFTGEERKGWAGSGTSSIWLYAVPSNERHS